MLRPVECRVSLDWTPRTHSVFGSPPVRCTEYRLIGFLKKGATSCQKRFFVVVVVVGVVKFTTATFPAAPPQRGLTGWPCYVREKRDKPVLCFRKTNARFRAVSGQFETETPIVGPQSIGSVWTGCDVGLDYHFLEMKHKSDLFLAQKRCAPHST